MTRHDFEDRQHQEGETTNLDGFAPQPSLSPAALLQTDSIRLRPDPAQLHGSQQTEILTVLTGSLKPMILDRNELEGELEGRRPTLASMHLVDRSLTLFESLRCFHDLRMTDSVEPDRNPIPLGAVGASLACFVLKNPGIRILQAC